MTNPVSYGKNGRNNFVNKNGKKNGNLDHSGKAGGNIRHNGGDPAKGTEYAGNQLNSGINSTVINKERTPTIGDSSRKVGKKGKGKSNDEGQKAVSAQTNTKGPRVLADISNKVTRKATKENNTKKITTRRPPKKSKNTFNKPFSKGSRRVKVHVIAKRIDKGKQAVIIEEAATLEENLSDSEVLQLMHHNMSDSMVPET
ncbi:hypothetical protein ACOSQ2_014311 [Xanthoceras sorbifolium]